MTRGDAGARGMNAGMSWTCLRTVCKVIGFQGFRRFKAIYFSIGAFFVNIVWANLAPFNSKEIGRFLFGRFSLVLSQTHVTNTHFLACFRDFGVSKLSTFQ